MGKDNERKSVYRCYKRPINHIPSLEIVDVDMAIPAPN